MSAGKSGCGEEDDDDDDDVSAGKFGSAIDSVVFVAALVVGEPFDVSASVVAFDAAGVDAAGVEAVEAGDLPLVEESDNGGSFAFCATACGMRTSPEKRSNSEYTDQKRKGRISRPIRGRENRGKALILPSNQPSNVYLPAESNKGCS